MTTETSHKAKKQAAQQSALEREQRQRTIRIAAIVIVAIFGVGAAIAWVANETIKGQNEWTIRPLAHPNEQVIPDEGRGHVEASQPLTYQHFPPSSGAHYPIWANPGFYDQTFSEGNWVHSLEHGYVVVLYNCEATDNCDNLKSKVRDFVNNAPTHGCDKPRLIGAPYSRGMSTPITVIAWVHVGPDPAQNEGRQLDLPDFDNEALLNFYKRYENHGPEQTGCP